jgi:hypothetical protein
MLLRLAALILPALSLQLQDPPIGDLLQKLRSDQVEVREEATRRLIEKGEAARAEIEKVVADPDPEVSGRALRILVAIDGSVGALLRSMNRLVDRTRTSLGQMIREATDHANKICRGKEWREVSKVLQAGGIPLLESRNIRAGNTFSSSRRYLLRRVSYEEGGFAFDLLLCFMTQIETSETQPSRNEVVGVEVVLASKVALMTQDFLKRNPFFEGTLLHRWVTHQSFREEAARLPLLSEIQVSYEILRGTGIQATLSSEDGSHGGKFSYWVPPGDPLKEFSSGSPSTWSPGRWKEWTLVEAEAKALRDREKNDSEDDSSIEVYSLPDLRAVPESATNVRIRWPGLADEHLPLLARARDLAELSIDSEAITEEGFKVLSSFRTLKQLTIYSAKGITDAGCGILAELPLLSLLHLSSCLRVTDEGLRKLATAKGLKTLILASVGGGEISDRGFLALKDLPNLEELNLWSIGRFSNEGVAQLRGFPRLHKLLLAYLPKVDDAGLQSLSEIPNLQNVELIELPITDKGVAALKGLTRAVYVRISQCEHITRRGVDEFVNAHPKKWIVK